MVMRLDACHITSTQYAAFFSYEGRHVCVTRHEDPGCSDDNPARPCRLRSRVVSV